MSKKQLTFYLIMYDIQAPSRLRQVAKILKSYGIRVQKSVFECSLDLKSFEKVKTELTQTLRDQDSVRLYPLEKQSMLKKTIIGEGLNEEQLPPDTVVI